MEENNTINLNNMSNPQPVQNNFVQNIQQLQDPFTYTTAEADANNNISYNSPITHNIVYDVSNNLNVDLYNSTPQSPVSNNMQNGVINTIQNNVNEQAQAQVVTPSNTSTVVNTINTVNEDSSIVNSTPHVIGVSSTVSTPINPQTMEQNKFKLKTSTLVTMVNNAKKAAICEDRLITTTIMQLMFDTTGFKIISTDGSNTLIQEDNTVKFSKDEKICVEAELFTKLVNKLDTEDVELEYDSTTHIINVISNGVFKLSEIYDVQTGNPIEIPTQDANVLDTDNVVTVDLDKFKAIVQRANIFAGNTNIYAFLSGIYCNDKVYSTDRICMFGCPNIPELQPYSMYLSDKFVSLLLQLSFPTQVSFIIRKDGNDEVQSIIIKTDGMTLYGPVSIYQKDYPVQTIVSFMNNQFVNEFKVSKNELLSILDKAELFIENNSSNQCCTIKVDGVNKVLRVATPDQSSDQGLVIDGDNIPTFENLLKIKNMIKSLRNCQDDVITIQSDSENKVGIKMLSDDIVQVIAYAN